MRGGDYLAGFGSAWERAPTTERLRLGSGCHVIDPAPNRCQSIFSGKKFMVNHEQKIGLHHYGSLGRINQVGWSCMDRM